MAWVIFAPRYLVAGFGLLVVGLGVLVGVGLGVGGKIGRVLTLGRGGG